MARRPQGADLLGPSRGVMLKSGVPPPHRDPLYTWNNLVWFLGHVGHQARVWAQYCPMSGWFFGRIPLPLCPTSQATPQACPRPLVEGNGAFPRPRTQVARRTARPRSTPAVPLGAMALTLRARSLRVQAHASSPSTSTRFPQAPATWHEAGSVPASTPLASPRTPSSPTSTTRARPPSPTTSKGRSAMPETRKRPPTLPTGDPDGRTSITGTSRPDPPTLHSIHRGLRFPRMQNGGRLLPCWQMA